MNFKYFFIFILFLFGCGVKAKPNKTPEKEISSYIQSYTGTPFEYSSLEDKSKKDKKK